MLPKLNVIYPKPSNHIEKLFTNFKILSKQSTLSRSGNLIRYVPQKFYLKNLLTVNLARCSKIKF